jgi:hypothetical protein
MVLGSFFIFCLTNAGYGQIPAQSWIKQYPTTLEANASYTAKAIIEEADGFVISGYRSVQVGTNTGSTNIFAFKINDDGDVIWFNNYDIANPEEGYESVEEASSMVKNHEGNYYITGVQTLPPIPNPEPPPATFPSTRAIVLEIMADGTQGKTLVIDTDDDFAEGKKITRTVNDTYLITGSALDYDAGGTDMIFLAEFTGSEEDIIAANKFYVKDNDQNKAGYGNCVTLLTDKPAEYPYLLAGNIINNKFDMFIMNTDEYGSAEWQHIIGGDEDDIVNTLILSDDEIFISGYSEVPVSTFYHHQAYLAKMDLYGTIDWEKTYGGSGTFFVVRAMKVDDGNIMMIGHMEGNDHKDYPFFLKANSETGDSLWYDKWTTNSAISEAIYTSYSGYLVAGKYITNWAPSDKIFLAKYGNRSGTAIEATQEGSDDFMLAPCYPNPLNTEGRIDFRIPGHGHVSLTVYNLAGQLVQNIVNGELDQGDHTVVWNVQGMPAGTYFLNLETNGLVRRQKVIIVK